MSLYSSLFFFKDTGGLCRTALGRQNIYDTLVRINDFQEMPTETLVPKKARNMEIPPRVDPCIIFI